MDVMSLLNYGAVALFAAGIVKGFVGLGLPTVAMGLLTFGMEPRLALSLILVPMLMSNLWQMIRGGDMMGVMRRHWRFAVALMVTVGLTVYLTREASDRLLLAMLSIALLIFAGASWKRMVPEIPPRLLRITEVVTAIIVGVIGGLTGGWGAPLAMYLSARRVETEEFIRASGFLIAAGSVPLLGSYAALGLASGPVFALSAALLVPTLLGFTVGETLRRRLNPEGFRKALIWVFFLLGLDLMRRAIML
ncbi:sulfite exporter TauE/SafE family protein [Cognatishimia sp. F0-27]|uniref:sulfite exporter TauE/SafE family protein n=1 Tax=Cognatishimia sp. F0-27 TaxID=2816855 RepID=UPI001D0C7ED1|nr:sulfite exporter TauE/SafE family protein [Cognatishimia sp. F0-27]MCC1492904.1 sulfite exporter TauE/SafE family protein [Cognatishimia sp. F0-27]